MTQEALKLALEKIATVNAMDYEYQAWAREALAQTQEPTVEQIEIAIQAWFKNFKTTTYQERMRAAFKAANSIKEKTYDTKINC